MKNVGYEVEVGFYIVDLTKRKVIHFIDLPSNPFGITFNGTSLICCVSFEDIHVISCKDYSISTIPNTFTNEASYVSTHDDKIFYTKPEQNKVVCCFFDGTPAWVFQDKTNLEYPQGITVDKQGNVFVVGFDSSNVLVLSSDGKHCKQILTKEDGHKLPYAIFNDKIKNQLLVTAGPFAYLYNISYL
ncbi:unnamed protein product [Mytilus edulis]|uniref:Uncharacterized protein n=1 Tax=Mytilus edulis TaxID=6550 RepID=A0A8S3RGH2_MYTED|nr:unnamed protein product [Mytilus edulis]